MVYAFTGREWDKDVDLQYNRMRWYDPVVGRWISEDPIGFAGGDANLVRYVGNNPVNWEDPSGLEKRKGTPDKVNEEWGYWEHTYKDRGWWGWFWGETPDGDHVKTVFIPDVTCDPNYNPDSGGPEEAAQRSRQWAKTAAGMAADGAETVLDAAGNVIPPLGAGIAVGRAAEDGANGNWWGEFWNSVCAGIAIVLGGSGGMKGNARVSVAGKPGTVGDGVPPKTPEPGTPPKDDGPGTSTQINHNPPRGPAGKGPSGNNPTGLQPPGPAIPPGPNGGKSISDLSKAGKVPDRGDLTAAGRSLTKHGAGARPGNSRFPKATGNPEQINNDAQAILDGILNDPGTKFERGYRGRFGETIEVLAPDGRGVVFDSDGKFLFFKEEVIRP